MNNWISFFIALWQNAVYYMGQWEVLGVPIIGIIVAVFLLGVMLRALLVKA